MNTGARLPDCFGQAFLAGRRMVVPFFPFLPGAAEELFRLLLDLGTPPSSVPAVGLVYPGRRVLPGFPARRAERGQFSPFDLFQFAYALKHQTGLPTALAIHYRDILDFGIFPFAQEGHKVGLELFLVKDPLLEELDYFSAEIVSGGVSFGVVAGAGLSADAADRLRPYVNGPCCAPDGLAPPGPRRLFDCTEVPFLFCAPATASPEEEPLPAAGRPGARPAGRLGWLLEAKLGAHWKRDCLDERKRGDLVHRIAAEAEALAGR